MTETILARIVSVVFHPLLLATYLFSIFAFVFPIAFDPINDEGIWRFIFILFCVTFVLPVMMVTLLRLLGITQTFSMPTRQERTIPFVLISVFYTAVTWVFYHRAEVSLNDNFLKFLIVINVLVLVCTLVTFFYKVSVHAAGVWGFIGILLPLNSLSETSALFYPLLIAIVLAGVIMSARLKLQAHNLGEVFTGSAIGLGTSFLMMTHLFRY